MSDPIADDTVGPVGLLEWGEPLAIAFYPDHAAKADLIARMHALALVERDALVLVEPDNEEEAVLFFDRNRDHFDDAKACFLILLLRGGAGERALQSAPALASFARDASFEVIPRPPHDEARAAFEQRYGMD